MLLLTFLFFLVSFPICLLFNVFLLFFLLSLSFLLSVFHVIFLHLLFSDVHLMFLIFRCFTFHLLVNISLRSIFLPHIPDSRILIRFLQVHIFLSLLRGSVFIQIIFILPSFGLLILSLLFLFNVTRLVFRTIPCEVFLLFLLLLLPAC